ncbi:hypothetical protein ES702_03971 [subsurface metagenome]
MKRIFRVIDTQVGLVHVRETEERFYVSVGRRDLTINKKTGEIEGSGTYVGEKLLDWELEHKALYEKLGIRLPS